MTDDDWAVAIAMLRELGSRCGDTERDDRKFLDALPYLTVNNVAWCVFSAKFGNWNLVWKRFWRLREADVFEALAGLSGTSSPAQMFDLRLCGRMCRPRAQKGRDGQALGRFRGGFSTNIHLKINFNGLPLGFCMTES